MRYGLAHRAAYGHAGLTNVKVVEEREEREGAGGHIKILVILVMFLLLMMIASIIISVVSLSHWNKKDSRGHYDGYENYDYEKYKKYYHDQNGKSGPPKAPWAPYQPNPQTPVVVTNNVDDNCKKDNVYTIAFVGNWGTHEFISVPQQCALRGFGLYVVLAACKAAGLTCKTMYAPSDWCFNYFSASEYEKHPEIGKGLLNNGITACSAYYPEPERSNVALFSDGYLRNPKIYLWYPSGGPSPTITSTTRIGFVHSVPWNEKCLKRYITRLTGGTANLVSFPSQEDMLADLDSNAAGSIVLAFDDDLFPHTGYSTYSDDHMICARGPAGLVTNKKNKAFIEKWNVGLEKIKGNGELRKICDDYDDLEWCVQTYWV